MLSRQGSVLRLLLGVAAATAATSCKKESLDTMSAVKDSGSGHAELYSENGSTENELWNGDCKTQAQGVGYRQSPIAINTMKFSELENKNSVRFTVNGEGTADLVDNGHTVKVNFPQSPASLALEGEQFNLKQFHFHAQSEHTIDGRYAPLETHFVFMNDAGNKAVAVGLMSYADAMTTPKAFVPVEESLARAAKGEVEHGKEVTIGSGLKFDLQPLFAGLSGDFYTYEGSLTTPPCSQIVTHMVYQQPVGVSQGFMQAFQKFYHNNFRRIQFDGQAAVRRARIVRP